MDLMWILFVIVLMHNMYDCLIHISNDTLVTSSTLQQNSVRIEGIILNVRVTVYTFNHVKRKLFNICWCLCWLYVIVSGCILLLFL